MKYQDAINLSNELTDQNMHTKAVIVMAEYLDTGFEGKDTIWKAYKTILENIEVCHELQGYIMPEQQAMRDMIQKELTRAAAFKKNITG